MTARTDWGVNEQVDNVKLNAIGTEINSAQTGFTYTQSSAAATWSISHTLGRYPKSIEVYVNNEKVYPDVTTPTVSTVNVVFASPQLGRAQLS